MMRCLIGVCVLVCAMVSVAAADSPIPDRSAVISSGTWGSVWVSGPTAKLRTDTAIPSTKQAAVNISAAGNEYEPFQLALRPAKQLTGVKISPRTLVGPKNAKLPAWNIDVRRVGYVRVDESRYPGAQPGSYPDPLSEMQPFTAPANTNSIAWVTVYVPDKTPAGEYSGTIDITADGGMKASVPVRLRVWGFSLPTVSRLRASVECSYDGPVKFQAATTLDQKRKLVDLYNTEFWRHRVSPSRPYEFHDIKVEKAGEQLKLSFVDFDLAVQKYLAKFNSFEIPGFGIADTWGLDLGEDRERLKIEYMRMVAEHLVNKGQIAKGYADLLRNTPSEMHNQLDDAIDLCGKADDRIKVFLRGPQESRFLNSVDIWAAYIGVNSDREIKLARANGAEVWLDASQSPGRFIESPAVNHRILPWLAWRGGLAGVRIGEVSNWRTNPYEKPAEALLYPPTRQPSSSFVAKAAVPSIRWELVREGIEDYDYFIILKERVDKARKANPSSPSVVKAEQALKMVEECAASVSDYAKDPAKLQTARTKVAEAIETLK